MMRGGVIVHEGQDNRLVYEVRDGSSSRKRRQRIPGRARGQKAWLSAWK